ncbi:molybdopterin molybdochelatase [Ferrimonas sediminum]|uniref:Molybdopterin molybdenumtransferase n=1 Tax=Ferrimonas sediminum TaxID=718193 RepID=A0A1G8JRE2_9GAMM|nr:molybdopterin molybdotransferase MoeA [Ferrimonas sediminum]SDI33663.1 molybdopterin molybdochelatase [Ferrimonas sediminum]
MAQQDCCSQPGLMLPAAALEKMYGACEPLIQVEEVALEEAVGRVLAQDVCSAIDLPGFDNSSMDGYAVRAAEVVQGQPLAIAGKAFAGLPFDDDVPAGACVRIMTGAPLPPQMDAIIMQEEADAEGDQVRFRVEVEPGFFVRHRGSELKQGQQVLARGTRIGAAEIGVLATVGHGRVQVLKPLTVALFSTGDELVPPGQPLQAGQIYDSNRHALRTMLQAMGAQVIDLGVIADDLEQVRDAFRRADELADVVVTSGGVSVGEADYIKVVLDEMGKINFWKLAIKPGKPFAFGKLPNSWFCGLPGNPVSSMVTCYQLVQPFLQHLGGEQRQQALTLTATLTDRIRKKPGRQEYQRGVLSRDSDGQLRVETTGAQGSDMTTSMSRANCFIVLARDEGGLEPGAQVSVEPFNQVLGGL